MREHRRGRLKVEVASALILVSALGLGAWRYAQGEARQRALALEQVQGWEDAQAEWEIGRSPAEPLRFPPADPERGKALVAEVGIEAWSSGPAAREALVVSWGDEDLEGDAPLVLAASTASLLGFASDGEPRAHAQVALAAQEELRQRYAPEFVPVAFPSAGPEDLSSSSALSAQRILRSDGRAQDSSELGSLIASIRRGEEVEPQVWQTPGACGMAALELGLRGREQDLEPLLEAAVSGPTASDRLAALYAARRLAPLQDWPEGEAKQKASQLEAQAPE